MRLKHRTFTVAALLLVSLPLVAAPIDTTTKRSHAQAKQVLNAAIEANGGAKTLGEVKTIILDSDADLMPRMQMPTADGQGTPGKLHELITYDLENNKLAVDQKITTPGFENANRFVLANGEGQNIDLRARTVTPIKGTDATSQQYMQFYRRLPNLLLTTAQSRDQTLRYLGEEKFNGRPHDVISFVHNDGLPVTLYIDRQSKLVSKYELIYPDALTGDEASEIIYDNYTTENGVKVPSGWTFRQAGEVVGKFRYNKVQINPKLSDASFTPDTTGFAQATPQQQNRQMTVEKLAEDVYVLQNVGPNYNVLAVGFPDHVFVMEAPLSSQVTETAIKKIKELMPNKPIKYVAVTHHHSDHMGGLRSFIAEGATVVTTRGNKGMVDAYSTAKLDDALAKSPRKPNVEFIDGKKRVFTGGEQVVELYEIGSPHAKEMMIAYLPKQRVVFQGDLFFVPFEENPIGPAQPATLDFAAKIKDLGLQVDKIAAVHGRTATPRELAESVNRKPGEGAVTAAAAK